MKRFSLLFLFFIFCFFYHAAQADIIGTLRITVKNANDQTPVAGAKIILKDSAGIRPDIIAATDKQGQVLVSQLEGRVWEIKTKADNFETDERFATVAVDTTTDVEINLLPVKEKVIKIQGQRKYLQTAKTSDSVRRDRNFIKTYPSNNVNPQSLSKALVGQPGFVADSVNQVHPRGEHSATAIYVNGFELPDALQGKSDQIISAETVQNVDIMTGMFAPEYGGETAAILNVTLRSGPAKPFAEYDLQGGGYGTEFGSITAGGQLGAPLEAGVGGNVPRRFGYLINLSGRRTENALDAPQPDNQTAHNEGFSQVMFGNFDYQAGLNDHFSITANSTPAYTQIANRTGLSDYYASAGQGYGYGGRLSRVQAAAQGIATQQQAGQDVNQRDANTFGVLNWRHNFSDTLFSMFSFGSTHTGQYLTNHNPAVNIFALPANGSVEFNPTLFRDGYQSEVQGSLTKISGAHTYKFGFVDNEQSGKESYQFIPASQIALDQLAAIDPILAPAGSFTGGTDAYGSPIYTPNAGAAVPALFVTRTGYYRAAYIQDTWKMAPQFTMNYGLRLDDYRQSQNLGRPIVDQANVSPRINAAYAVTPNSVLRLSYDSLFIQPPMAQGAIIGAPIQPETLQQYEAGYEFLVAKGQTVKISDYYKLMQNQIDTGLLFPGTQIGAFTSVNFQHGYVHGEELSYNFVPPDGIGLGSWLGYTYQVDMPSGPDNTGAPAPIFNDHDQRNTLGLGISNTWPSKADAGLNFYYGSGVASSVVFDNTRTPHTELDLHFGTGPVFFKSADGGGSELALDIVNAFDDRALINFNSGFSGTRFMQGRQILLSMDGKF